MTYVCLTLSWSRDEAAVSPLLEPPVSGQPPHCQHCHCQVQHSSKEESFVKYNEQISCSNYLLLAGVNGV